MKRGGPLKRTGGLKRGGRLKRSKLKPMSEKQMARKARWAQRKAERIAEIGCVCERCGEKFPEPLLEPHHVLLRSQHSPEVCDEGPCMLLCRECHRIRHDEPWNFEGEAK